MKFMSNKKIQPFAFEHHFNDKFWRSQLDEANVNTLALWNHLADGFEHRSFNMLAIMSHD